MNMSEGEMGLKSMDGRYDTNDEIAFVNGLGTHRFRLGTHSDNIRKIDPEKRVEALELYLKNARLRTDWGHINSKKVVDHTINLIVGLRRKMTDEQ